VASAELSKRRTWNNRAWIFRRLTSAVYIALERKVKMATRLPANAGSSLLSRNPSDTDYLSNCHRVFWLALSYGCQIGQFRPITGSQPSHIYLNIINLIYRDSQYSDVIYIFLYEYIILAEANVIPLLNTSACSYTSNAFFMWVESHNRLKHSIPELRTLNTIIILDHALFQGA
jgi:hypothetical protein